MTTSTSSLSFEISDIFHINQQICIWGRCTGRTIGINDTFQLLFKPNQTTPSHPIEFNVEKIYTLRSFVDALPTNCTGGLYVVGLGIHQLEAQAEITSACLC